MNSQPNVLEPASVSTEVDREALLAALVLAPTTFARNRFFALFKEPHAAQARTRAGQLRMIVRHLASPEGRSGDGHVLELAQQGERALLRYRVPALHLLRTAVLEPLELALVRFALSRRGYGDVERAGLAAALLMTDDDGVLVKTALAKLSRELHVGGS